MPRIYFRTSFLFLFFSIYNLVAQNISGVVVGEDRLPLEFVSVALLQPKDSLLVKYTSTDEDGKFIIAGIKEDSYLMQIYLMTYQANQFEIVVNEQGVKLDTTVLSREVNVLDEIVITSVIPIKILQDTIAFNTKAFKVRQDDNVGELIKKLPGIEVEADGTVIAQGKEITKILVDGKEFFSSDPTIALQNLSADAIFSVEIIDESSDDTRVSGVQDGEKNKIINLVLKEGKKFGYFGKAGVGLGTNDRYRTNVDLNSFTNNTQVAVFGNLNNINNTGSSIFQRDGTKGNSNNGFITTSTAGVNYNYEFKPDFNFNLDYYYNYTDNEQASFTNRTEFTNDNSFDSDIKNVSKSISNNHNLNFSLRDRSKKGAYLVLRGKLKNDDRRSNTANNTIFFDENDIEDTKSDRLTNSEDNRKNANFNFSYRKKLAENGRNFRLGTNVTFTDNFDQDNQVSVNEYNVSDPDKYWKKETIISQDDNNEMVRYNFSVRYMEPIVKHHYIIFSSSINNEIRDLEREQLKMVNGEEQNAFDYEQDYLKEQYDNGIGYQYSINNFQLSASVIYDIKKQSLDLYEKQLVENEYTNFLPRISSRYEIKKNKVVKFNYNKSIGLPNVNQLSPVINDFNPLRISFGNPNLKASDVHNLNLRYYSNSLSSENNFYGFVKYMKTNNAIVTKRYYDENKVRYATFENYGSKTNLNTTISFSRKINKINIRYAIKARGRMFDNIAIIEGAYNDTNSKSTGAGLSFSNINKNVLDVIIGANADITKTKYSLQDNTNYLEQNYYSKFDWDVSSSLNFNSQFNYTNYTNNNSDSQSVSIWNAAVEYVFMKGKQGILKFQVFDILNKNVGIEINSTPEYYEEVARKNLGTYAMLSFSYSLKPPSKKETKRTKIQRGRHQHS